MNLFFLPAGRSTRAYPRRVDLPAFFWRDNFFHYSLLTTDRLLLGGSERNGNGFRFHFPQRKPVSVSIFPVETVTH